MSELLNHIQTPSALKTLSMEELKALTKEIREFLLHNISKTGGHLASNLGVTELTLALHYVYDSPKDKIVFDVGHQCYVHKILTGRQAQFPTLRQTAGMSGFPKRKESEHDCFDTGHASTSISAGLGMARGRDLAGEKYSVISIIGDGSMTGGMAFEALNDAGHTNTNLTVVLNDNQMSIDKNVGGLSKYLNTMRTEPTYISIKGDVDKMLRKIPVVGNGIHDLIAKAKDGIKQMMVPGMFFEEMGFTYVGPVSGHNLQELISVFQKVKKMEGPVLVHVVSTKGRGYKIAEKNPTSYHGVAAFDVKTGKSNSKKSEDFSAVFGKTIIKLAQKDKKIVAVTAAMPSGTGLTEFAEKYPDRWFDVGIAEQHAVTMCAGLAASGYKPVLAIYSTFLQRAYDQVIHDVCIQNLPVVFAIDRAGIVGADGETHQGVFDISFLGHIPNMTIMAPKDSEEMQQMLQFGLELNAPVAIRYPRGNSYDLEGFSSAPLEYGVGEILHQGQEIAIIPVGHMVKVGMEVAEILRKQGYEPTLINPRFIKPMDSQLITRVAKTHKYCITIEDGAKIGGFGSQVGELLLDKGIQNCRLLRFGWKDEFIPHGSPSDLYHMFELDSASIASKVLQQIEEKVYG